jgi:hypothetical protein
VRSEKLVSEARDQTKTSEDCCSYSVVRSVSVYFVQLPIQTPSIVTLNHVTVPWSWDVVGGRSGLMIEPIGVNRTGWAHSFILEIEAAGASERIVLMYHTVRNHISVDRHVHVHRRENLKSHE